MDKLAVILLQSPGSESRRSTPEAQTPNLAHGQKSKRARMADLWTLEVRELGRQVPEGPPFDRPARLREDARGPAQWRLAGDFDFAIFLEGMRGFEGFFGCWLSNDTGAEDPCSAVELQYVCSLCACAGLAVAACQATGKSHSFHCGRAIFVTLRR